MKKTFTILAAAVACMFGFSACEGVDLSEYAGQGLLGDITIVATNPTNTTVTQPYADGDTITFKSAMCNVKLDSIQGLDTLGIDSICAGAVIVGTKADLLEGGVANINFPLIGVNLRDTVPGDYAITLPEGDFRFLENLNETNWPYYVTHNNIEFGNIAVIALSENDYYLCYSGTVHVTEFSAVGSLVKGSLDNVRAAYITRPQLEALLALSPEQREAISFVYEYFPRMTFNGTFESRRANMETVIQALDEIEM